MLKKIDRKLITEEKHRQAVALKEIIMQVFGISWRDIINKNHDRKTSDARHAYLYMLYYYIGFNTTEAARNINMDHSTVIKACKKIEGFYQVGDPLIELIEKAKIRLNEYLS